MALAAPANAQFSPGEKIGYNGPIVGPIIGVLAAIVVVVILAVHYSKKRSVTGCVTSGAAGMTITDEHDRQVYALSGDTSGIKAGERMKLKGKKAKSSGPDKTLGWNAKEVSKDYGLCQP